MKRNHLRAAMDRQVSCPNEIVIQIKKKVLIYKDDGIK